MEFSEESLKMVAGIAVILLILFLLIAILIGTGPGDMFDSFKGMFAFITTYLMSQLSLILR